MKSISLVQANFPMSIENDTFYLPYSIGMIWSYVSSFATNEFKLNKLIFRREPLEQTAVALAKDTVIGFSCYMWNRSYNLALAKRIKELNPNVITVFGGPEMEISNIDFFKLYPYIDVHIIQEGEIAFKQMLDYIDDLDKVSGIIYNKQSVVKKTDVAQRIIDLDQLPSPYLDGTFDLILQDNPSLKFLSTIENTRGCPYQCTFCDWGSLTYNKIRQFNLDRIYNEIEWIFAHDQLIGIDMADANFGMLVKRDSAIVDKIINEQIQCGRKINFQTNYAKNQNKAVVKMVKRLAEETDAVKYLTVSLQSLNDDVLAAVKRKNLAVNKVKEIFTICEQNEISLKVELILGLPEDTLEDFKNTHYKLFDISPDIMIQTYRLLGLNNSELYLTKQGDTKWKVIKSFVPNEVDDIKETFQWVYSTSTMSHEDILEAINYTAWITTLHSHGFTNIVSYYAKQQGMSYKVFYEGLYRKYQDNKWVSDYLKMFKQKNSEWYETGNANIESLKGVEFAANNNLWHLISKIHADNKFELVFNIIIQYLKENNLYNKDVINIQKQVPIKFNKQDDYPFLIKYNNKTVKILNLNDIDRDEKSFISNIYYKRERSFGKAKVIGFINA